MTGNATPATLFEASRRDFVSAEVWPRPGLDRRSRYVIAIASVACMGSVTQILERTIGEALNSKALSLEELREAALHFAAYGGWLRAIAFDAAVSRVAAALALPAVPYAPLRSEPADSKARRARGAAHSASVMGFSLPDPASAFECGAVDFVFGEVWSRPGLDMRARRWITLTCAADSGSAVPVRSHVYSAMASGDVTLEEMNEFVLQYAVHVGWPRAVALHAIVQEMGERVAQGLPLA